MNKESTTINQSADVWSIGMVFYEILSAEVPFDNENYRNLSIDNFIEDLKSGARPVIPKEFLHINWLRKMVICSMLCSFLS
jgi:serine/threonine protein kinase